MLSVCLPQTQQTFGPTDLGLANTSTINAIEFAARMQRIPLRRIMSTIFG